MLELVCILLATGLPPSPRPQGPESPRAELRTHLALGERPLDGPARVKLVLSSGARTLWTHDGTGDFEHEPETGLDVDLREGELLLELGAPPQQPLPDEVLACATPMALHLWVEVEGRFLRLQQALPLGGPASADLTEAGIGLRRSPEVVRRKVERKLERLERSTEKRPESPQERESWRRQMRLDEDGDLALDALLRAKRQLDAMPLLLPGEGLSKSAGLWSWSWLGPGNIGGRARALLIHPTQHDTMWLGTAGGGIWKTTDGGGSWSPVDDFLPSLAVSSLAMKPGDPSVLYAGTGEGFGNGDALPGAGILRSDDGGKTWSQLASTNPATAGGRWRWVNRLATVPSQPDILFAAVGSGRVMRSNNGGYTWFEVLDLGPDRRAHDIKVNPFDDSWVAVGGSGKVFTSSGLGNVGTWVEHTTGLKNKLPADGGRCEVAFAKPGFGETVRLYVSMDRSEGALYRSTDAGATWSLRATGYMGEQGWYNNALWVDPTDGNKLVFGGLDLFRSDAGGAWFVRVSDWRTYHSGLSAHADQHLLVEHPAYGTGTNRTLFVANDGGIQKTPNVWNITSPVYPWENLANGLGITQFYGGAAQPDGSLIVGGAQDNDTLRYKPAGGAQGWYQAETGDGGACAVDWINTNRVFAEYTRLEIERSTDGGNSYDSSYSGLADAGKCCNATFIAPFEMNPNSPTHLIAGGTSIWHSTNSAGSWTALRGPITDAPWSSGKGCNCADASNPRCTAIAFARNVTGVYYVGYESGRVSRTVNYGGTWDDVDTGLPSRYVTDIAVHPLDANTVFVTFGGYEANSIWYTSNGGATWAPRSGTAPYVLPEVQLNTVTFHPARPEWVYVGTDLGVLASEDLGVTWSKLPTFPAAGHEGPVNTEISHLFWQGGQYLLAATHGRGMYRARPFAVVYVDKGYTGTEAGTLEKPYKTVAAAKAAAPDGCVIAIKGATYFEAPILLDRSSELRANGGSVLIQ